MSRAWLCAATLVIGATPMAAQDAGSRPPALVVVVTVDQLRYDYLVRFRREFRGGFARLLERGAVLTEAYHDHGITETAPGHAVVLSGRYAASNNIIRNSEGVPDTTVRLLGVEGPGASPFRFRGSVLLDWMRARWPGTRMLSVSRKDRGAIPTVGAARDGVTVLWYSRGRHTTSTFYADTLPAWVTRFDSAAARARRPGLAWRPLRRHPEPDSVPLENRGSSPVFPHVLAADTLVHTMPWMDSLTLQLALAGVRELGLGRGPGPDIVAVSVSTVDHVGHAFGPVSQELHDMMLRLDRYLGAFLTTLERRFGRDRLLIALTADHGVTPRPEQSIDDGLDAGFVPVDSVIRPLIDTLAQRIGAGLWLRYRQGGMVALDRAGIAARGVNVDSLADLMAARLRALDGVAQVDTRASLAATDTANTPVRRWRRMLNPGNPGEVFITLVPRYYFGWPRDFTHGQPSDDDAHVPIILVGPGVRPGSHGAKAAVVDLAPTLAVLLGVTPGEPLDGRVLREALR